VDVPENKDVTEYANKVIDEAFEGNPNGVKLAMDMKTGSS